VAIEPMWLKRALDWLVLLLLPIGCLILSNSLIDVVVTVAIDDVVEFVNVDAAVAVVVAIEIVNVMIAEMLRSFDDANDQYAEWLRLLLMLLASKNCSYYISTAI
jgi:hypothetical protein